MNPSIEISSLSVNRLKSGITFEKYNIDVSIDELENDESGIKLKYKFVLLSTPTNAKISVEGLTSISGNENETARYLEPDEKNIPLIVNIVYQEILPLLYVLTKSIDIPCPAYKISQISQTQTQAPAPKQVKEQPQIPAKEEVVEPAKEEVVEPAKEEVVEPAKEEVVEPAKEEVVEPAKEEKLEIPSAQVSSEQSPTEGTDVLEELEKLVEEQRM